MTRDERSRFLRSGGQPVQAVYGPAVPPETIGVPGRPPFTRGVHPSMYRSSLWTMRQYAGFGSAEASNRRYRMLLERGGTGLSVAFDLPTQMGHDSDAPLALGEVGRVGVAIDSLGDMHTLLAELPLADISTSMTINATGPILLALYVAVAESRGIPRSALRGTIQNDVLKEYIARGTYIFPPRPSLRLTTDCIAWCTTEMPKWNPISISGYHIREAGSTAAQEIAFTLADGLAYVESAIAAGLAVDAFAPRLSFFFNSHNHLLEEVAKFRAARRLWARLMATRCGAKDPKSLALRFHTQTAGSTLTAQQVDNNVVRVTVQALAAVLGGTQSLHTNGRDEALALPSEASATLALRTQQILAYESGVADVVDPLGGSWAIEALTDELEAEALAWIDKMDAQGGMVAAIEAGLPQRLIQEAAYAAQLAVERGESVVVGVNRFTDSAPLDVPVATADPRAEADQVQRTVAWRAARTPGPWRDALAALVAAASGTDNLMPHLVRAVSVGATVGEVSNALRGVFGEHRPS